MDIISMEYEIEMAKIDNVFENVLAMYITDGDYACAITESTSDIDELDYLMTEAANKFVEKTKKVFDAIIEAIKKFINNIKRTVKIKIEQKKMRESLKKIEKIIKNGIEGGINIGGIKVKLDKKSIKASKKTVDDLFKIYKSYTDKFITLAYKVMDAKTAEELTKLQKLTNDVMHTVDVTLDDAIDTYMCLFPTISENFKELSDEVTKLENRLNTLDEIAYKHIENIKSMIEKADDIDEEESMNEKNDDNGDGIPNPQKVTFLKRIANKISSMTEKIANAISRHPFNSYNAINTTIHAHKQANDMAMQAHKQATDAAMHAHKQANDMAMQAQTQANNMAMQAHMQATGMMW